MDKETILSQFGISETPAATPQPTPKGDRSPLRREEQAPDSDDEFESVSESDESTELPTEKEESEGDEETPEKESESSDEGEREERSAKYFQTQFQTEREKNKILKSQVDALKAMKTLNRLTAKDAPTDEEIDLRSGIEKFQDDPEGFLDHLMTRREATAELHRQTEEFAEALDEWAAKQGVVDELSAVRDLYDPDKTADPFRWPKNMTPHDRAEHLAVLTIGLAASKNKDKALKAGIEIGKKAVIAKLEKATVRAGGGAPIGKTAKAKDEPLTEEQRELLEIAEAWR